VDPGKLKGISGRQLAVRFAFGAVISAGAALTGHFFGHRLGGLFLAFPAILPATLTLVQRKEGNARADSDVRGAVMGGFGLVGFAIAGTLTLSRIAPTAALALASAAWLVVSLGLFLLIHGRGASDDH